MSKNIDSMCEREIVSKLFQDRTIGRATECQLLSGYNLSNKSPPYQFFLQNFPENSASDAQA